MPKAGEYNKRLRWLTPTITKDADVGQDVYTHENNGYLWCNVDEYNGRRTNEFNAVQTGADAIIRVRRYPDVTVHDLLLDEANDYFWHIEQKHIGDNEVILDCHRNDELESYTYAE